MRGRFSDAFHTYTIEWTPSRFRILFDGTVWLSDSHVSRVPKSFGLAVGSGDNLAGSPTTALALAGEAAADHRGPPRALPAVVAAVAVLAVGSSLLALRARRSR